MAKMELASFLKGVPMFAGLPEEKLHSLASASSVHEFDAGAPVNQDGWKTWVWIPVQGLLRVVQELSSGDALTVLLAGRGELVGCVDATCKAEHELTCAAVVSSLVVTLPRERVMRLVHTEPTVAAGVIRSLSDGIWSSRELRIASALTAEQRLARVLIVVSKRLGSSMPLTRKAIAELSGLARETAIRGLAPLEQQGLIRSARGRVEIMDAGRLAKVAALP